ncbi:carbamoyltransferase [Thalassospira sp. NFXS8]|uniref:carbamoyltransferase family protein n=1 Tax=Thalassospira sp. NFXS8 TaxID=2819093 RepID=UPI0032DF8326
MENKDIYILGVSAFYHDSAAALIKNGQIVSAVQEERFSRVKNDCSFPIEAIKWILSDSHLGLSDIDHVVFYEKPFVKFERILATCIHFAPKGFGLFKKQVPTWLKEKIFQRKTIQNHFQDNFPESGWNKKLFFSEHHLSHCAAAFYPSPFEDAAILTIDGVGERVTTTVSIGRKGKIERLAELNFPHSFGLLYSAVTAFLGFKVNSGEYKVMGLAPYGSPIYSEKIKETLVDIRSDGSFRLRMKNFRFATEMRMFGSEFEKIFCTSAREPESNIEQIHMDIAASVQQVSDELFLMLVSYVKKLTKQSSLCLGGGVALNCASTGKVLESKIFDKVWVQPSAGDAGSALGAALAYYHIGLGRPRAVLKNYMPFLGPEFTLDQILADLDSCKAGYQVLSPDQVVQRAAQALADGKVLAWMQGRAEFSPRALGHRSILADPRVKDLKKTLNLKIKFRESFRPFAPAVLEEDASNWFDLPSPSPLMNFICKTRPEIRDVVPSVVHVDGTARVQTVSEEFNPDFYKLILKFKSLTNCPVLVNTSLNVRGEPMVLTPADAYRCFMNTRIDCLVIGNVYLEK